MATDPLAGKTYTQQVITGASADGFNLATDDNHLRDNDDYMPEYLYTNLLCAERP